MMTTTTSTNRVYHQIKFDLYDEATVQEYLDSVGEEAFNEYHQGIYLSGIDSQNRGQPVTEKQLGGIKATHMKISKWLGKPKGQMTTRTAPAATATQLDRIEALLADIRDAMCAGTGGAQ